MFSFSNKSTHFITCFFLSSYCCRHVQSSFCIEYYTDKQEGSFSSCSSEYAFFLFSNWVQGLFVFSLPQFPFLSSGLLSLRGRSSKRLCVLGDCKTKNVDTQPTLKRLWYSNYNIFLESNSVHFPEINKFLSYTYKAKSKYQLSLANIQNSVSCPLTIYLLISLYEIWNYVNLQ